MDKKLWVDKNGGDRPGKQKELEERDKVEPKWNVDLWCPIYWNTSGCDKVEPKWNVDTLIERACRLLFSDKVEPKWNVD